MKNALTPQGLSLHRSYRYAALIVSLLLLALLALAFSRNLIDFPVYYKAGQSLVAGRTDLYAADFALGQVMDYRYPPFFLVALYPLWLLPYKLAAFIWCVCFLGLVVGSVLTVRRLLPPDPLPRPVWALTALTTISYFVIILHYGNAHLPAIFFLLLSLYLALKGDEKRSAFLLALALTLKLTPGFFLLYFLLKKQWKFITLTLASTVFLNLLPMVYFGIEPNTQLLRTWLHHVVINQEFHEENGPINLSLKGQLKRYLTDVEYEKRVDGDTRYPDIHVANISATQLRILWLGLSLLTSAAALSLILVNPRDKNGSKEPGKWALATALELSLLTCLLLFIEPLTSKIYFIVLLLPVVALSVVALDSNHPSRRIIKMILIIVATANFVLPLLPGRHTQRFLLVAGVDFYVNLLLLAASGYALWGEKRFLSRSVDEQRRRAP